VLLLSCGSSRRSIGVEEGWELLSEQKVNFVRDKDEIVVSSRNQYSALKFRVEDRDVRIHDLKVYFQNGDKLEPNLDAIIAADQYSRDIELGSDGRVIDKIEFKYRTTGTLLKGRANVLLFGKKAWLY
jgi:hypothetical protein